MNFLACSMKELWLFLSTWWKRIMVYSYRYLT